jgi:hypothetical protein
MNRRYFLETTIALPVVSVTLPNSNAQTADLPNNSKPHVYLVHYDNTYTNPLFYTFSSFEGAKKKVVELMNEDFGEDGYLAWHPVDVGDIADLWQWEDGSEYLSIWKKEILV